MFLLNKNVFTSRFSVHMLGWSYGVGDCPEIASSAGAEWRLRFKEWEVGGWVSCAREVFPALLHLLS